MFPTNLKKAFTLIELLVVVAIISLLSSVIIASLQGSREKAAIAKIKEQIGQIQIALELYRNDNGEYPNPYELYGTDSMTTPQLISTLSNYIGDTTIDTSAIKSFTINTNLNIYSTPNIPDWDGFSCDGYDSIPYFIFMGLSTGSTDQFIHATYNGSIQSNIYCLNKPL